MAPLGKRPPPRVPTARLSVAGACCTIVVGKAEVDVTREILREAATHATREWDFDVAGEPVIIAEQAGLTREEARVVLLNIAANFFHRQSMYLSRLTAAERDS